MKFDGMFPPMPQAFEDAIQKGIRKGEKRMKLTHKLKLTSIAACFIACVAFVVFAAGTGGRSDDTAAGQARDSKTAASGIAAPSPTPENAGWPGIETNEKKVYMTERGIWYHDDPTCQGMQNAMLVPISEAREEHKLPCPVCIGETVYATANGRYYHSDPNCSGLQNAGEWMESDAKANGKLPCPVCLSDKSVDQDDYRQKALEALEDVFPGCTEVYKSHYNIDQLYPDITASSGAVYVELEANGVTVAEVAFDGNEKNVCFRFNDVEICGKILACMQEDALSDKLNDLYAICKNELIGGIMTAIHNSARSHMPAGSEYYSMKTLYLTFHYGECMTARFDFATQYYCEASFTFDIVEGDNLSSVTLNAY